MQAKLSQLDKAKKEQKNNNAEDSYRLGHKTGTKSLQIPETESVHQEEQDRNEVCVVDNTMYACNLLSKA